MHEMQRTRCSSSYSYAAGHGTARVTARVIIADQRYNACQALSKTSPGFVSGFRKESRRNSIFHEARPDVLVVAHGTSSTAPPADGGWWMRDLPSNLVHIHGVQELVDELADGARNDQLVVLEFFAPWCAACKALFPKMKKLCIENPDVRFLACNFDENRAFPRQLGVKVLPYFHFYRGAEGRVAEFPASISKVKKLREAIEDFKSDRCFLEELPAAPLSEYPDVYPGEGHSLTDISSFVRSSQVDPKLIAN